MSEVKPRYEIGQKVAFQNWVERRTGVIIDIKWVYHRRVEKWCWGYMFDGYTGFTFKYVPEGYLREVIKPENHESSNEVSENI